MQAETSVIAAPNGIVAVAWIDVGFSGDSDIGYTFSADNGGSFGMPVMIASPDGRVSSDPVLAVDQAGNIYLTWVGFKYSSGGNIYAMQIYVAKAPAGATDFGDPILVSPQFDFNAMYDKPWITVTNTGTILITYERDAPPAEYSLVAARSTDGGATWNLSTIAMDKYGSVFRNLAFPCAPKDGSRVWVTYAALTMSATDIRLAHSDDGGATWAPEVTVNLPNEEVAFDDPTCVAENNDVWVSYGLTNDQMGSDMSTMQKLTSIQVARSTDGGQTIADRTDAADLQASKFFMHPTLALADSGALDIAYYAGQHDGDDAGTYRRARALPGGSGFGPSVVVEAPLTYLQARSDPRWLGDYTGLSRRGGELYMSYVVNTTGLAHVAFAKAYLP